MSTGTQAPNYQCRTNGHDPRGWNVGFPAKRKNPKKKFFTTISLYFRISKMRNFSGFLRNFASICFAKNAEFSRIRKCENFAKKCKNFTKNTAKLLKKKNTKILRNFREKMEIMQKTKFKILIIHKPSMWSRDVPQKIWAWSVQPFWRLLDTNKQTNGQTSQIYK